jgi:hypothetical protein
MHIFDKTRPHGVIYGHPVARFEQNGIHFDGSGREVVMERMKEIEELVQIANEVEEKRKLEELAAKGVPEAARRRGRPPGSKNRVAQASE